MCGSKLVRAQNDMQSPASLGLSVLFSQKRDMNTDTIRGCKLPRHLENPVDDLLMVAVEPFLEPLRGAGVTPNMLTLVSMIAAAASVFFCFSGHPVCAMVLWLLNYVCDIADGFMARRYNMETAFGSALDHISDVLSFCGLMAFVASRSASLPRHNWPLGVEIVLLLGAWLHMQCQEKDTPHLAVEGINGEACLDKGHLKFTRFVGTGTLTLWHLFLIHYYST